MDLLKVVEFKTDVYNFRISSNEILKNVIEYCAEPFEKTLLNFCLKFQFLYNHEKTFEERIQFITELFNALSNFLPDKEIYTKDDFLIYLYFIVFYYNRDAKSQDILEVTKIFEEKILPLAPSSEDEFFLKEELKYILLTYHNAIISENNITTIQKLLIELKENQEKQSALREKYHIAITY